MAKEGESMAMWNLGACYEGGSGTNKNHQLAYKWYLEAADHGYDIALYSLSTIYFGMYGSAFKYDPILAIALATVSEDYGIGDKRIECLELLKSFQSKHSKKQISDGRNLASQVRQNFEKRRLKLFIQDWESKPTAYRMSDSEKASKKVRLKIKHLENKKEIATKNKKLFDKKRHEILAIHRDGRMSDEDAVRKLKNLKDEEARKVSYEEQQDLILLHHSAGLIDDNEATKRLKAIKNN
jgi:hypothetical protein